MIVSLLATTIRNRAERAGALKQQQYGYAKALFAKRVEVYPELYCFLSDYAKTIRRGEPHMDNLG